MNALDVRLTLGPGDAVAVGRLARRGRATFFEYAPDLLEADPPVELSPLHLAVRPGLIEHTDHGFGPTPGLFDDSLPDGWGRLLMDREMRRRGHDPRTLSPLDRLLYLGTRTMGALTYHPPAEPGDATGDTLGLAVMAGQAARVLSGESDDVLPQLLRAGGSPGGARPKVVIGVGGSDLISGADDLPSGYEPWLVKFAGPLDPRDAGRIEYACAQMAAAAGLTMPATRLFETGHGKDRQAFFGVRRFDREPDNARVHVHTLAGLLHADYRVPTLDYGDLLRVTSVLTHRHGDVCRGFRQMLFNLAIHNRDDHAKNFAFTLDPRDPAVGWRLSPAYDLTPADGPGGEHTLTFDGEGLKPSIDHCRRLAAAIGVRPGEVSEARDAVNAAVARWPEFAGAAGCSRATVKRVADDFRQV